MQKDWERCDQETKDKLLDRYNQAVDQLDALGDGGGHADYYLNTILPQKKVVDQALGAYQSCAGFTDYQVASSQANLSVAQAAVETGPGSPGYADEKQWSGPLRTGNG